MVEHTTEAPTCAGRNWAHTPGPWRLDEYGVISNAAGIAFADIRRPKQNKKAMIADGSLIAAAPDLLAALKAGRTALAVYAWRDCQDVVSAIDAAIAKAEGRADA